MKGPEDIALIYAGQIMQDEKKLQDYNVPPVSEESKRMNQACWEASLSLFLSLFFRRKKD